MNFPHDLEKCLAFINCQLQPAGQRLGQDDTLATYRAVTISRQTGSGGYELAEKLAGYLQMQAPAESPPWVIFDRNLVEKVLADHHLPVRLAKFMTEDRVSQVSDTMDELFGLHPPCWTLVRQTSETILRLAQLGRVILLGRGANVVTGKLPEVFHVRLVGSLEQRVKRLRETRGLDHREAVRFADREDLARRRYLKQFFDKDIEDPQLYHLVINTDRIDCAEAARIIALMIAPKALALAA